MSGHFTARHRPSPHQFQTAPALPRPPPRPPPQLQEDTKDFLPSPEGRETKIPSDDTERPGASQNQEVLEPGPVELEGGRDQAVRGLHQLGEILSANTEEEIQEQPGAHHDLSSLSQHRPARLHSSSPTSSSSNPASSD